MASHNVGTDNNAVNLKSEKCANAPPYKTVIINIVLIINIQALQHLKITCTHKMHNTNALIIIQIHDQIPQIHVSLLRYCSVCPLKV